MCFREEKDEICNSLLLGICISLICEILIIPWTNSLPLLVRLHQIIVLPCPYPIHDSLLLFHQLKAPHLVRSWSNNASSLPPPFCNRAEHHQSHPESLQDKNFWSEYQASQVSWTKILVQVKEPKYFCSNSLFVDSNLHPQELDEAHPEQVCQVCWIGDEPKNNSPCLRLQLSDASPDSFDHSKKAAKHTVSPLAWVRCWGRRWWWWRWRRWPRLL